MPKIRARSRPLVKCANELCTTSFRQWRRRRYCSGRCRKNDWRARHIPYYAKLQAEALVKKKRERRQSLRNRWVMEGHEDQVPERLTLPEAIAQASPETIEEIKELLPEYIEAIQTEEGE